MDIFKDNLTAAVKQARKERKLTQEKLGEIIGCDGQTIGQIERRQTNPESLFWFRLSVDQFILDIHGKKAVLYQDNGFRTVWDPSTFGQLHEKDLKYCYNKTGEWTFDKHAEDLQIPLPYGRECSCRGEIHLCVNQTRGINPFRDRFRKNI